MLKPWEQRSPEANTTASNCIKAAIEAVHILESMEARAMLYEAYAFTVDVLVMAATSLLVIELMPPGDTLAAYAKLSSWKAKALLEKLAVQNCTAARSLEGLAVGALKFSCLFISLV